MGLYSYREGWQSENLAKYILSKFSFISEPVNISDDFGADFIGTAFRLIEVDKNYKTQPLQSFVVQIKSHNEIHTNMNFKKYANILNILELPFFLGIINRDDLTLNIYAGMGIPILYSFRGSHILNNPNSQLIVELTNDHTRKSYDIDDEKKIYSLRFILVATITADYSYKNNPEALSEFFKVLNSMQENISSRLSKEYIFRDYGANEIVILAGPGSVETFRGNFYKRLAECFHNLAWMRLNYKQYHKLLDKDSKIFESVYQIIAENTQELPSFLASSYQYYSTTTVQDINPIDSSIGSTGTFSTNE
jgi:hypothetical protein